MAQNGSRCVQRCNGTSWGRVQRHELWRAVCCLASACSVPKCKCSGNASLGIDTPPHAGCVCCFQMTSRIQRRTFKSGRPAVQACNTETNHPRHVHMRSTSVAVAFQIHGCLCAQASCQLIADTHRWGRPNGVPRQLAADRPSALARPRRSAHTERCSDVREPAARMRDASIATALEQRQSLFSVRTRQQF